MIIFRLTPKNLFLRWHHLSPSYLRYFGTIRVGHFPASGLHFSLCVASTHFPYRIINPVRGFCCLFQTGLLFSLGQLFRKRLYDLRRHVGPSQSFQRLDHQTRHVRQTRDFLVGSMLKFQLGGIPLIGLIRAVADIGPDRRYLCREPQQVQGRISARGNGPVVTPCQCFGNCIRVG